MERYYVIEVTTNNSVNLNEFNSRTIPNETLCNLIGNGCEYPEIVHPRELYLKWNFKRNFETSYDQVFVMIVDENVAGHCAEVNYVGSLLYGYQNHKDVILGNVLFMATVPNAAGNYDLVGAEQDGEFIRLFGMLGELAEEVKAKIRESSKGK